MKSFTAGVVAGVGALLPASPVLAQSLDRGWWMMSGWGWDQMPYGGIMMILFWGAIILIVALVARGFAPGNGRLGRPTPSEIIEERYARGEIDQKEYEERRQVLSNKH
jgi:putative membrane protein